MPQAKASAPEEPELSFEQPVNPKAVARQKKIEQEIAKLQAALSSGRLDTVQERVAWILNRYPGTRDSDITLQLKYWENFESEMAPGSAISKADLYKLARLTSISRARAKIQNQFHLFKASAEVQKRRGVLEEEELEKAREQQIDSPSISVYADESGKNESHLVIGEVSGSYTHLTKRSSCATFTHGRKSEASPTSCISRTLATTI